MPAGDEKIEDSRGNMDETDIRPMPRSLPNPMRRLGQIVMNCLLLRLAAVEAEEDHVVVDPCLKMHGSAPDAVDVLERFDGELDLDIQPVVFVGEVQFAAVAVVAV